MAFIASHPDDLAHCYGFCLDDHHGMFMAYRIFRWLVEDEAVVRRVAMCVAEDMYVQSVEVDGVN